MDKKITLIEPNITYENQLISYKQEFFDEGKKHIDGGAGLDDYSNISEYLEYLELFKRKETVPNNFVTSSTYMAINEDDKIVGIVNIRHELNEYLLNFGGHIGYGVCKSERQKGYATEMLRLAILKCKELGIDKVLVTCNFDNIASEKTIKNNGGIFENEIFVVDEDTNVKRFWIDLK